MNNLIIPTVLTLATVVILTATGCNLSRSAPTTPTVDNVNGGNIVEVNLQDGTRCAVWDGFKAGGISCDWK